MENLNTLRNFSSKSGDAYKNQGQNKTLINTLSGSGKRKRDPEYIKYVGKFMKQIANSLF